MQEQQQLFSEIPPSKPKRSELFDRHAGGVTLVDPPDERQDGLAFSEIYAVFMGRKCPACDGPKGTRHGFCGTCFYSLPRVLRDRLYRSFGSGYEGAHQGAHNWLKAKQVVAREKDRVRA